MAYAAAIQLAGAGVSALASNRAAKQAGQSQAEASQAAAAGVSHAKNTQQFFQRQLGRSQALYNRAERNRARVLEGITVSQVATQTRQRLNRSKQQILKRIESRAAARGVQTSGLAEDQVLQVEGRFAELDSQAELQAKTQVLDILASGIQPGLQREAQLNQAIGGASNAVVGAYGTQANTNLNIAGQQLNSATNLGQAAGVLAGLSGGKGAKQFSDLVGSLGGGS